MRKRDTRSRFLVVVSITIIILMLTLSATYPVSSNWSASGSSGDVVQATGTYTTSVLTTNAYGQTVTTAITTTGAYVTSLTTTATSQYETTIVTTSAASTSTTTSTSLGEAWLNIVLGGFFKLLDPNGNPTQTLFAFEIEPWTGGGTADSIALDATYDVEGAGVDWSTLKVDCSTSGLTAQPKVSDPNESEVVNQAKLQEWTGQTSRTNSLKLTTKIDTLVGGKSWDHNRKLTAAIGLICTASAKKLAGYELAGGGDEVSVTLGPIVGQSHLKWKEQPAPATTAAPAAPAERPPTATPPTYTPTTPPPSASTTPPKTAKQTCNDAGGSMTGYGYCSMGAAAKGKIKKTTTEPTGVREAVPMVSQTPTWPLELLGLNFPLIEVYGADSASLPIQRLVFPAVATIFGLVVVFFLFRRKKRKRV